MQGLQNDFTSDQRSCTSIVDFEHIIHIVLAPLVSGVLGGRASSCVSNIKALDIIQRRI